jgi:hypothetical protein
VSGSPVRTSGPQWDGLRSVSRRLLRNAPYKLAEKSLGCFQSDVSEWLACRITSIHKHLKINDAVPVEGNKTDGPGPPILAKPGQKEAERISNVMIM